VRIITDEVRPLGRRLLWFVALWAAGVLSVAIAASALRWPLHP